MSVAESTDTYGREKIKTVFHADTVAKFIKLFSLP